MEVGKESQSSKGFLPICLSIFIREKGISQKFPQQTPLYIQWSPLGKWPPPSRKVGKQVSAFSISDVGCGLYLQEKNRVAVSCCIENQQ